MLARRPRPKSLALPSTTQSSGSYGPMTSTLPSQPHSILKNTRHIPSAGDLESDVRARPSHAYSRLDDETAAYKRRLETYRQAQHEQAMLVARLQSKLLQYKQRCSNLESKLGQSPSQDLLYGTPSSTRGGGIGGPSEFGAKTSGGVPPSDLEDASWRLDQERVRNDNLIQLNRDLRSELDETRKVNESLSGDLQRLSDDWEKLTQQMVEREQAWKAEEQAYSDYYTHEHARLLRLWKKVAATKRDFAEMKSTTGRELAQLRNSLTRTSNQISAGVINALVSATSPQQESQQAAFIGQLTHEVQNAQQLQESLRKQIKERDDRITNLEATIIDIEGRMQGLDSDLNQLRNQDLALLCNSLKEIGKMLISDFDQHGLEDGHDVHLTSSPGFLSFEESAENPTVFAESVVSAVQAILNKRQLQIHQLQVNLSSAKEQGLIARGHVDALESDLHKNEQKLSQVIEVNEKLKDELSSLRMEKEAAQRGLENAKSEKNILESQRKSLASELESTLKVKVQLATSLTKLEKSVESNRDEVDGITLELNRVRDELNSAVNKLKLETDLNLRIREQLSSATDDRERNASENKSLKNQINELTSKYEDIGFQFERSEDSLKKWKMDAEILSEKFKSAVDRTDGFEKEKRKWQERARQLEESKKHLEAELTDARNDLSSLRRETLEAERIRSDLETKMEKFVVQSDGAENRRAILESQIESQREEYLRELNLMSERIDMLNEELGQNRREYEEAMQLLERAKADLSNEEKLHTEATHLIDSKDAVIRNLATSLEKLKDDKYSLEELEHTLKSTLVEKDKKLEGLEKQLADVKAKTGAELNSLRDKLSNTEMESKISLDRAAQEKTTLESKFVKEMAVVKSNSASNDDKIRAETEEKIRTIRSEAEAEKRNEVVKLTNEINSLKLQIEKLRVQYEEALLRAENDKQQGLLLAQQDQQGLNDKIRLLEKELDEAKSEKERLKRECEAKCTHERNNASSLRSEVIKLKNELETSKQDNMDTVKQIEIRLEDIERERESALMQVEELRSKLRSTEERESEVKRELNEIHRKLRDSEASGDHCKQELSETRRSLTEVTMEKEKTNGILEQLKEELSRRENDIALQKKELNKVQNQAKHLERLKVELESEVGSLVIKLDSASKEKAELNRQYEDLADQFSQTKSQSTAADTQVAELKLKLDAESERRDEAEAHWRNSKKLLEECEAQLGATKQEEERLALKLTETEEKYANKEGHFLQLVEEYKLREKKLYNEKHNLNVALMSLQQEMEQQMTKVAAAEHRLKLLTDEKTGLERMKKESENKLAHIQSGFKRLGILSGSMENPESARRAMTSLQTQMTSLQQDRDTIATQLASTRDSLTALEVVKSQMEDQLNQLSRSVQSARAENKAKDTLILNVEKEISLKNSELSRMSDKIREIEDTLKLRDSQLRTLRAEKDSQREELQKARHKMDDGKAQSDSKLAKAEVQIRALEGDLSRVSLVLSQKDTHIQALEDKNSLMQRSASELEGRCSSLTLTLEQLNIALEKAGQNEQDWKDKYSNACRNYSENSVQNTSLNEKLRSLQRDKAVLEQEKNTLSEKWEAATVGLQEFKRQVQNLTDKNQKLKIQTEEIARNAVEKQLKAALSDSGKEDLRQHMADKLQLQRKVDSLLDRTRDLEKENRELERLKDSIQIKGGMGLKSPPIRDNAMVVLEEENSDLRRKISKMEAEIRDLERRHTKHIGEVTLQVKQERDFELERARASKLQAERLLEAREGSYRQQVQRLEQQVANMKEQLAEEIRRRQTFLSRSFRNAQDVRHLRQALGDSLRNVAMDPNTLESETRRLDSTLDFHKSGSQTSLLSPLRDQSVSPALGYKTSAGLLPK